MAVTRNPCVMCGVPLSMSDSSSIPCNSRVRVELIAGWRHSRQSSCCPMALQRSGSSFIRMATDSNNSVASTAASEDGIRINGGSDSSLSSWWQEAFANFDASLQGGGTNLLQLLHEGARIFQIAMERNDSLVKGSWLGKRWTGFDSKAWMKLLSYQVSVYALLQAAMEIAVRGEGRDRDVHVFVQRSLSHQCGPLEESIKKLVSSRDPSSAEWLWSQQLPVVVTSCVNILEKDPRFAAVTSTGSAACPSKASDTALLRLTISTCGAAMKLGPATISCPGFSSTLLDEIGRLMNMLTEFVPISEVYTFACNLGLRREFLSHFGSRGANNIYDRELEPDERAFWVDLSEQLLRNALVREGVLSKLRSFDTAEALERDLAVFGLFAALGRRARAYLSGTIGSQLDEPISSLLRYLEGGVVLFYPQLSTLTYYQLFVEVVREEMEWLPTFPKTSSIESGEGNLRPAEKDIAIYTVLNVCSRWVADFLKYSTWVQEPAGLRVVEFLLKSQSRLIECREAFNLKDRNWDTIMKCVVEDGQNVGTSTDAAAFAEMRKQLKLFDEDLQNMEEAICKLESLLENLNKSEKLAAARKDLEKIRRLKKEAEALEASIKAKADGKVLEACSAFPSGDMTIALSVNEKAYSDVFNKSIEKLKDASADLWRGTQLLSNDVAAATILLKNGALGQQLTDREKKTLRRTFTDLASVIPIGVLMLLPVTAVGHAAMLAAIQKYVPALIPSAYNPERLDLLRQLEQVKQMETESEKRNPDA